MDGATDDDEVAISVIVCTRDRAASLRRTLASFEKLTVPIGLAWEIVVVDNGSTDDTPEVVDGFRRSLPIRRVMEDRAGLSHARNRGVAAIRGRNIVWTDDDVEVHHDWLRAYSDVFDSFPKVAIFGGGSMPVFEEPVADWVQNRTHLLRDLLAIRTFGPEPVPMSLTQGIVPFGLNYAVRADVQRKFLYDPDLGVAPNRRISGEEVDFYERVLRAGFQGMCLAAPIVYHHIPSTRQTLEYVRSYYFSAGETSAILRYRGRPPTAREYGLVWAKFAVARMLSVPSSLLPTSLKVPAIMRDAFHTGRVRRMRTLIDRTPGLPTPLT